MSTTTPAPGPVRLAFRQVRYQVRLLLRSPTGPFFTFVIPVMVLLALNLVYGSTNIPTRGVRFPSFYTPAMAAFAIINACYVNLLTGITLSRDTGMLKRIRGTPLPPAVYLIGRAGSVALLSIASAGAVIAIGTGMYPVNFPWHALPVLLLAGATGTVCFCCLGIAASAFVKSADVALPIAYGTLLPISFISDVFFPMDRSPLWLRTLASSLPLRPLARSLEAPFLPFTSGSAVRWGDLGTMVAWTVFAILITRVRFRWERPEGKAGRRRVTDWRPSGHDQRGTAPKAPKFSPDAPSGDADRPSHWSESTAGRASGPSQSDARPDPLGVAGRDDAFREHGVGRRSSLWP